MKNFISILLFVLFLYSCAESNDGANGANATAEKQIEQTNETNTVNDLSYNVSDADKQKFADLMKFAASKKLSEKSIPEIEIEVAKQLLGIPYVAHTLEKDSVEKLTINLQGLDCTTFVENVVTLSLSIKSNNEDLENYCKNLTKIRYKDGKIDKYPSRLHYFTDWLLDNEQKGVIEIISNKYGDADFDPTVYYMSKNWEKYKKLKDNPEFVEPIAQSEKRVSAAKLKYFTPEGLKKNSDKIQNGDVIAFATTKAGLDISHVAIAYFKGKDLHFYHASYTKKEVVLSEKNMLDYLSNIKTNNGVLVARIIP